MGKDSYFLHLSKPGRSLHVWLDINGVKEITIGDKDYRIRGDELIKLTKMGTFDIIRREIISREFPLESKGEEVIIDLRKIEGNDK